MQPTILLPVRVLEGESIPDGVPELLAHAHVVLLGYHVVPEQTATGQARMQFEERANDRLDDFEALLQGSGASVETRLVFTHEAQATIDRIIDEEACDAVLVPKATGPAEDVLVAVRGTVGIDRLGRVVAGLFAETDVTVTLFHVAGEDESADDIETLLDGLSSRLVDTGVDESRVRTEVVRGSEPLDALVEVSQEYDTIVMGESDPSLVTFVFGMRTEQVAERFLKPVFVVQRGATVDAEEGDGQSDME